MIDTFDDILFLLSHLSDDQIEMMDIDEYAKALFNLYH